MNELLVKYLLYSDVQVLLASSAKDLQAIVTIINEALERNGMKVNAEKTKLFVSGLMATNWSKCTMSLYTWDRCLLVMENVKVILKEE